ncbi:MAG: HsdM family class I SAM-dependent methyltransferase [Ginsengibacter sp.]
MLTPQLQKRIDEKWNNCWPVSDLRPLALLDLVSYLFFIKKLDDWELIHPKVKAAAPENFIFTNEIETFTWSKLQTLNARQIQQLFNKENGVIDLMNNYAQLNGLFSDFFKAPLLIEPTPKLIFNSIEIINIIETSDKVSQGAIIEYLFSKSKITAQNGHEFLPEPISKLLVSIAEPFSNDVVLDPCVGNGSLLINSYRYISENNKLAKTTGFNHLNELKISGLETDLVQLRLAGINMVLHGIKNPKIHFAPAKEKNIGHKPTLIISNLLFSSTEGITEKNTESLKLERENSLLNEILESLDSSGRAIVLVPQPILNSDNPAIIKTRKHIVENFNLEGVITLAPKSDSMFSNACILVFNRLRSTTSDVWFYKWANKKKKTVHEALTEKNNEAGDFEMNELVEILNQWKSRKESRNDISKNSFFIPANYIKTNNYHLSFNDYKLIRQQDGFNEKSDETVVDESGKILAAKKENLHEFFETSAALPKEKKRNRLAPVLIILFILLAGAGAFYWFYLRNDHHHLYTGKKITDTSNSFKVSNVSENTTPDTTATNENPTSEPSAQQVQNTDTASTSTNNTEATKYTVINKAYFHYQPDSTKKKPVYLTPRKDLILSPKDEKNGFVYVVYVNSRGQATHGWLSKKDLEAIE